MQQSYDAKIPPPSRLLEDSHTDSVTGFSIPQTRLYTFAV